MTAPSPAPDPSIDPRTLPEARRAAWRPWLPLLLAVLLGGGMMLWTALALPGLPNEVPVHWGADGKPDRWEPTSFFAVAGGMAISLLVIIPAAFLAPFVMQMSTRAEDPSPWRRLRITGVERGIAEAMGWLALLTVLLTSWTVLEVLTGRAGESPWWIFPSLTTLLVAGVLPLMSWAVRRWTRWADDVATGRGWRPTPQEAAEEELWTPLGLKKDPSDPSAMVSKREGYGVGTTVNIGSPAGRALYWGFIGLIVVGLPILLWVTAFASG